MKNRILKVSHPGKYIKNAIEALNISQNEFAVRVGMTPKNLNTLINEKSNITYEVAEKLASFFDNSIDFWTGLQNRYESFKLQEEKEKELENEWEIVKLYDKTFLKECCGVTVDSKNKAQTIVEIKKCLMVSSLSNLNNKDLYAFCKIGKNIETNEKEIILRNSWITLCMKKAEEQECEKFDIDKLKNAIPLLRELTLLKPEEFTPKLIKILNSVGIKYVELPYLKNSNICGVTKWLKNNESVVVAVNDYSKYADRIWFTIFHELGHVIRNNKKQMSISLYENQLFNEDEEFANNFAMDCLINKDDYVLFVNNRNFSMEAIIDFSKKQKINKDIVIGRLEKDKRIPYGRFKKDKYKVS